MTNRIVFFLVVIHVSLQVHAYDTAFAEYAHTKYCHALDLTPSDTLNTSTPLPDITSFVGRIRGAFKSYTIAIPQYGEREKAMLTLKAAPAVLISDAVINQVFVDKMELVYNPGAKAAQHLMHFLTTDADNAASLIATAWGKKRAVEILTQPTNNVCQLQTRQTIIKTLVENPQLLRRCSTLLQEIADNEDALLSFWGEKDLVDQSLTTITVWPIELMNTAAPLLETKNQLHNAYSAYMLGSPLMGPLVNIGFIKYASGKNGNPISYGTAASIFWEHVVKADPKKYATLMACVTAYAMPLSILPGITMLKMRTLAYRTMQDVLIKTAACTRNAETVLSLFKKVPTAGNESSLFVLNKSKQFDSLLRLLRTNTFSGSSSIFSYHGRIALAYKQMQSPAMKQEFAQLLNAVGELDVYVAVAKKMLSSKSSKAPYTFAQYLKEDAPCVVAVNCFNPFVAPANVVSNTVTIGGVDARVMIISGPNTGGKSTLMKGVMYNLLLAQTLGVAAAESFECTPFANLDCYLNIADDTASGKSGLKAAVLRAKGIIESLQALGQGQYAFLLLDELFSGTSPDQVEQLTYEFMQKIATIPNCLAMSATHYQKVLGLEAETAGVCKNYRMGALLDENGMVEKYTYLLQPGISTIHNALQIAHEQEVIA